MKLNFWKECTLEQEAISSIVWVTWMLDLSVSYLGVIKYNEL